MKAWLRYGSRLPVKTWSPPGTVSSPNASRISVMMAQSGPLRPWPIVSHLAAPPREITAVEGEEGSGPQGARDAVTATPIQA